MSRIVLTLATAAIVLVACTSDGGAGPSASTQLSPPPSGGTGAPSAGEVSLPASITDPIVADAAGRLSVDPAEITILAAHAETFPDGSLGCPEPGMMYTQALVDGYRVVVGAGGLQLDYRGTGPGQFRVCENP